MSPFPYHGEPRMSKRTALVLEIIAWAVVLVVSLFLTH